MTVLCRLSATSEQAAKARAAREFKRIAAVAFQDAHTEIIKGVRIRPAIGKTGGSPNVGWEMHKKDSPDWYVGNKEEALRKLEKFLAYWEGTWGDFWGKNLWELSI